MTEIVVIKRKDDKDGELLTPYLHGAGRDLVQLSRPSSFAILLDKPECKAVIGVLNQGYEEFIMVTELISGDDLSKAFLAEVERRFPEWCKPNSDEYDLKSFVQSVYIDVYC